MKRGMIALPVIAGWIILASLSVITYISVYSAPAPGFIENKFDKAFAKIDAIGNTSINSTETVTKKSYIFHSFVPKMVPPLQKTLLTDEDRKEVIIECFNAQASSGATFNVSKFNKYKGKINYQNVDSAYSNCMMGLRRLYYDARVCEMTKEIIISDQACPSQVNLDKKRAADNQTRFENFEDWLNAPVDLDDKKRLLLQCSGLGKASLNTTFSAAKSWDVSRCEYNLAVKFLDYDYCNLLIPLKEGYQQTACASPKALIRKRVELLISIYDLKAPVSYKTMYEWMSEPIPI